MKVKLMAAAVIALAVGLFFSHTFAYQSGINSVVVETQADALDAVADNAVETKAIQAKDSERYAELDKANKKLQNKYDKLLQQAKSKVTDNAKKYDICTYDSDTLQLLMDSASGGSYRGKTSSTGSGFDYSIPRSTLADNWYKARIYRTDYRERQKVFYKPLFAPVASHGGARSPGSGYRA